MDAKFSGIFVEVYLLSHDLHDCTFKINPTYKNSLPSKSLQFRNISSKLWAHILWAGDVVSTFRHFTNVEIMPFVEGCPIEGLQRRICKNISNSFHDGKLGVITHNLSCELQYFMTEFSRRAAEFKQKIKKIFRHFIQISK